ncbi:hypothetical protein [Streptomyces djakartensis]|nr:hypothetical protein [Streptomyces djakartensis]
MHASAAAVISRFFCAVGLSLVLLAVGACSNEDSSGSEQQIPATQTEPDRPEPEPDPEPKHDPEPAPEPKLDPEPEPEPEPEPQGYVPESVVGVWCGGRNDTPEGHWTYAFTSDGEFAARNQDGGFTGYVVTEGGVMTFYVEGGSPFQSTWSVSYEEALGFNLLYLDDFSYVPGSCDS